MDKIDILMWAIGGGFAGTWAILWHIVNTTNQQFKELGQQFKELREEVKDIDRRLCRIEGALSSKD